jgi:hypothetical protein
VEVLPPRDERDSREPGDERDPRDVRRDDDPRDPRDDREVTLFVPMKMSPAIRRRMVIWGSLLITVVVVLFGGTVAGAYYAALYSAHRSEQQAAVTAQQQSASTCLALETLDNAKDGIKFTHPGPSEIYIQREIAGIHGVVVKSHCAQILKQNGDK